jgi:hypothetical protein
MACLATVLNASGGFWKGTDGLEAVLIWFGGGKVVPVAIGTEGRASGSFSPQLRQNFIPGAASV